MGRRSIGILSGSGPEAGVDLWGKILAANRALLGSAYRGDIDAPRVQLACTELSLVELSLPGKRLVDVTREVAWRAAKLSLGL